MSKLTSLVVACLLQFIILANCSQSSAASTCRDSLSSAESFAKHPEYAREPEVALVQDLGHQYFPGFYQTPIHVYRGQASRTFNVDELFDFMWTGKPYPMESWSFKRSLVEGNEAQARADAVAAMRPKIEQQGIAQFMVSEMMETLVGMPESSKQGFMVPTGTVLEDCAMYGLQLYPLALQSVPDPTVMIFDIQEQVPRGFPRDKQLPGQTSANFKGEYFITSFIPIRDIKGVYIDVRVAGTAEPEWIYMKFSNKKSNGTVRSIDLYHVGPNILDTTWQSHHLEHHGNYSIDAKLVNQQDDYPKLQRIIKTVQDGDKARHSGVKQI